MASITINPVKPSVSIPSDITGKEKIIAIDSNGRPATITIN